LKNLYKISLISLVTIMLAVPVSAQSLEETLQDLIETNSELYLSPVVTAFGTGVNSGTFRIARPHKLLGFDLTLNASVTTIPEAAQTFEFYIAPDAEVTFPIQFPDPTIADVPVTLSLDDMYESDRTSATFFGSDSANFIEVDEDKAYNVILSQIPSEIPTAIIEAIEADIRQGIRNNIPALPTPPGIINTSGFPMIMPQFGLGLPFGIELTLRGIPSIEIDSATTFSFFGYGGKIGLNQFVPTIPLVFPSFSLGYYATNLSLGDVVELNNSIITLQASKSVPFLTLYGGIGIENSSMDVNYTFEAGGPVEDISFSIEGDNKMRTMIGVRLKLALLSINADINKGEYDAYNFGIGLTFR